MTSSISRFRSCFEGVASAMLRRNGHEFVDLARRWQARRAKQRELEVLLCVDEHVLRDIGLTRREVAAAIKRLRAASFWAKDAVPKPRLTSMALAIARWRQG